MRTRLLNWYRQHKRSLPWRETTNPYHIWLSEIILQQTRVNQGLPYYQKFVKNYPTVQHLAEAHQDEVLKDWEGLGYYSRARNLHAAAKTVAFERQGEFPENYNDLLNLKGVGDYTAAAIASFSYGEAKAVLDGNVFRVLSRIFAEPTAINTTKGKKVFKAFADELLNQKQPDLHNQAIMEFGALQCVPKNPNCEACPLNTQCLAFAEDSVGKYPVKEKKTYNKLRHFYYLLVQCGSEIALQQRQKDIWQGLFEFPLIEMPQPIETAALLQAEEFKTWLPTHFTLEQITPLVPHKLSHQTLNITVLQLKVAHKSKFKGKVTWFKTAAIGTMAFPRPLRKFLDEKQLNLPFV